MDTTDRPLIFYGAGGRAIFEMDELKRKNEPLPVCFCDKNPAKHGKIHCGLPVMSLEQARKKYGNFDVFVTPHQKNEIFEYLTEQGIKIKRIINLRGKERYLSCRYLEQNFIVNSSQLYFCCLDYKVTRKPTLEQQQYTHFDMNFLVSEWIELRDETIENLKKGVPTKCDGCSELSVDYWDSKKNVKCLTFFFDAPCNLKCNYCKIGNNITPGQAMFVKNFDYAGFVELLIKKLLVCDETTIHIASGEISVNPRKNDIFNAIGNFTTLFSTNAVVFDEEIARLSSRPGSSLTISPDAGTRQTYKRIKGVDAFDRVFENINRYAEYGAHIDLKYIVLPENCNNDDVYGFIDKLQTLKNKNAKLSVSADAYRKSFSDNEIECAAKIIRMANEIGIPCSIVTDMFEPYEILKINNLL